MDELLTIFESIKFVWSLSDQKQLELKGIESSIDKSMLNVDLVGCDQNALPVGQQCMNDEELELYYAKTSLAVYYFDT